MLNGVFFNPLKCCFLFSSRLLTFFWMVTSSTLSPFPFPSTTPMAVIIVVDYVDQGVAAAAVVGRA